MMKRVKVRAVNMWFVPFGLVGLISWDLIPRQLTLPYSSIREERVSCFVLVLIELPGWRVLLHEVAECFRESSCIDLHFRLQLSDSLVEFRLDLRFRFRVGSDREESPHCFDALVSASRSAARVFGGVLHSTIQPSVLAQPVVHQSGDVLPEGGFVRVGRVDRHSGSEQVVHQ